MCQSEANTSESLIRKYLLRSPFFETFLSSLHNWDLCESKQPVMSYWGSTELLFWGLRGEVEGIWGDDNLLQGKGKAVHVVGVLNQVSYSKGRGWRHWRGWKEMLQLYWKKILYELKLRRTSLKFQRNVFWPWRKIHFALEESTNLVCYFWKCLICKLNLS